MKAYSRHVIDSLRLKLHNGNLNAYYLPCIRYASSTVGPRPERVVFSGIQPTGVPHLGNYLGALREWVKQQNSAAKDTRLIYSIADLHAITVPQKPALLRQQRRETLAALLAVGLDPDRSIIFYQSAVPAHTELMWILSCTASMGYLSRMTQWKSKLSLPEDSTPFEQRTTAALKLGLFSYPVLQAADILVHRATHVPVGGDQSQHLEFAREVAEGFNRHYGKVLTVPTTVLSPAKRIMSLRNPNLKMSKSHPDVRSRILISDTPEVIRYKIRFAISDSVRGITYDPEQRPGVSNLIEIMSYFESGKRSCSDIASEFADSPVKPLKEKLSDCLVSNLSDIRLRYEKLLEADDMHYLDDVAAQGTEKARASADETMALVRKAVGFESKRKRAQRHSRPSP